MEIADLCALSGPQHPDLEIFDGGSLSKQSIILGGMPQDASIMTQNFAKSLELSPCTWSKSSSFVRDMEASLNT
jgi:hypothetical protein